MNGERTHLGADFPHNPRRPGRLWLHIVLFVATLFTTTVGGALGMELLDDPLGAFSRLLSDPAKLASGLPFAVTLMSILLVHEMGHYLMSRYHRVRASLPFFLPAPPFPFIIGTFGAFIRMESPPTDRRSLFDVGAAGPLAGLALAIPAVIIGLALSTVTPEETRDGSIVLGSSLLLSFLSEITLGFQPDRVVLHPIGFAGWVGLLVTMMNLLPVGQLDGGHVAYALFGPRHIWISRFAVVTILALGLFRLWDGWLIWGLLLLFLGARHPAPIDPYTRLDLKRQLLAWLTLAILVLTFIPVPFSVQEPKEQIIPRQPVPHRGAGMNGGPL